MPALLLAGVVVVVRARAVAGVRARTVVPPGLGADRLPAASALPAVVALGEIAICAGCG